MKFDLKKYQNDVKRTVENYKGEKIEVLQQSLNVITQVAFNRDSDSEEVYRSIERIFEILFRIPYMNEPLIPISFMDSELGRVMFSLRYADRENVNEKQTTENKSEQTYSVKDIAAIRGISVQAIYKDVNINLFPIAPGSKTFYESEVIKYLLLKEVPLDRLYSYMKTITSK